jgi:hypothetical protein
VTIIWTLCLAMCALMMVGGLMYAAIAGTRTRGGSRRQGDDTAERPSTPAGSR